MLCVWEVMCCVVLCCVEGQSGKATDRIYRKRTTLLYVLKPRERYMLRGGRFVEGGHLKDRLYRRVTRPISLPFPPFLPPSTPPSPLYSLIILCTLTLPSLLLPFSSSPLSHLLLQVNLSSPSPFLLPPPSLSLFPLVFASLSSYRKTINLATCSLSLPALRRRGRERGDGFQERPSVACTDDTGIGDTTPTEGSCSPPPSCYRVVRAKRDGNCMFTSVITLELSQKISITHTKKNINGKRERRGT